MRIPLATTIKTRTGVPAGKDARLVNSYVEVKGGQSVVRKRPIAQGGVSVGTGTAQGGYGTVLFWSDTPYVITEPTGTSWDGATSYSVGDHVAVGFIDYWALTDNTNSQPPSADWSQSYVPSIPFAGTYATWGDVQNLSLSGGNLIASGSGAVDRSVISTIGKTSGKWYFEIKLSSSAILEVGITDSATHPALASSESTGTNGDVFGIAINMDFSPTEGQVKYYLNGSLISTTLCSNPAYALGFSPSWDASNVVMTANFGASAFAYSVPSGYNSGLYT